MRKQRSTTLRIQVCLSLIIFSFTFFGVATAQADNTNPPKILSVEQITSGPYEVGDIVSFKVNYTGGNPGIKLIEISGAGSDTSCVSQSANLLAISKLYSVLAVANLNWEKGKSLETGVSNNRVVSGFVIPCIGRSPRSVTITDETELRDSISDFSAQFTGGNLSPLDIEAVPTALITPVGEIKPIKINDSVSIKNIPKSPRVGSKYELPRITQGGAPIFWQVNGNCSIDYKTFKGDIGGTLKFMKPGRCELLPSAMVNDKLKLPKYTANIKMQEFKQDIIVTVVGVFIGRK
jgi:hypothetical protein